MRLNEVATEAAAHRAAVVTLLRSYLRHGRRGPAARAAGVSPSYLSRVLSDRAYTEWGRSKHRQGPRYEPLAQHLAAQLADWLGLDSSLKDQLLEHADLSHESHVKIETAVSRHEPDVILLELLKLHAAAGRESNPSLAHNLFTIAYRVAKQLVHNIQPRDHPLEFAQICLVLNDLEAVLNRNVDGIYHARLAEDWVRGGGVKESNLLGKDAGDLWSNALFAQAVSSHNLGLDKEALFLSSVVFSKKTSTWSCEAALNILKYTPFAQRTSIRQVDDLLDKYLEAVEKFGSGIIQATTRISFLDAKLRAYLTCGPSKASLKKADTELENFLSGNAQSGSEYNRVSTLVSQMGVLRWVIFLNTYSKLLKTRGDFIQAEKARAEAEARANRAGLAHQLAWIRSRQPNHYSNIQNAMPISDRCVN